LVLYSEINKCNTTNVNNSSAGSGDSHVILALTDGRDQARGEVGIAALDVNSPKLILCQISDNLHYSDALNKVLLLNPSKILLPDTIFETVPLPKLIQLIKESFNHINIIPIQRRHFNDKLGLEQITMFCSQKSQIILQMIPRKYYC
jgi:DNA mismatch repair protein MSH4